MKKRMVPLLIFALVLFVANESGSVVKQEKRSSNKKPDNEMQYTYKIGGKGPAGGWIFYDKGSMSGGWRYLEAAPVDQGNAQWGCYNTAISGSRSTAIGCGKSNTQAIIGGCSVANIAAKVCTAYQGGGKSDWFLPSKDELNLMFRNLKLKGVGGFAAGPHWSSSEAGALSTWSQYFSNGTQSTDDKASAYYVRAVRAF